jgi:tRNA splicing endonuclease
MPMKKKDERKKIYTKMHSQSTKEQADLLNRSTLNSFYQIEENKKRMLKKIQHEKERVNDMRLSEAFFITKYGSRFRIDSKVTKE